MSAPGGLSRRARARWAKRTTLAEAREAEIRRRREEAASIAKAETIAPVLEKSGRGGCNDPTRPTDAILGELRLDLPGSVRPDPVLSPREFWSNARPR